MKTLIIILIIVFITYEFIEHLVFPLIWSLIQRKKKSACGSERMLGEVGEVKKWDRSEGYVFVGGELWKAVSNTPLKTGNKVVVKRIESLTLIVDILEMK